MSNDVTHTINRPAIERWVAALRSGSYTQGKRVLRMGNCYCCLGVACEVFRQDTGQGEWVEMEGVGILPPIFEFKMEGDRESAILPKAVTAYLGLPSTPPRTVSFNPTINGFTLADHNDEMGATFDDIARMIEVEYLTEIPEVTK